MISSTPATAKGAPAATVRARWPRKAGISDETSHTPAIKMSRNPSSASLVPVAGVIANTGTQNRRRSARSPVCPSSHNRQRLGTLRERG